MTVRVETIALSTSSCFYDAACALTERLTGEGLAVLTPRFDVPDPPSGLDAATKQHLTVAFLDHIRRADALYVLAPGGYVGMSVALETGFAHALGKPVFLSEATSEPAINVLAVAIVASHQASSATLVRGGRP